MKYTPEKGIVALSKMRAKRWSYGKIAKHCGVSVSLLSRIATGDRLCTEDVSRKLCEAYATIGKN